MRTNEEIVRSIQRGEDRECNISILYEQNRKLCYKAANRFYPFLRGCTEDLDQEAAIALILAADTYDPDGGATFASYAFDRMTWDLIRYIDNYSGVVRLPVYLRGRIRAVNKAAAEYTAEHGNRPDPDSIARMIGITSEQVESALASEEAARARSLDAPVSDEPGALTLEEVVPDPDNRIDTLIEDLDRERLARVLWSLVDDLGERQASAVRAVYQEGLSVNEMARRTGMAKATAHRTVQDALRNLRKANARKQLSPYLEAKAETQAYKYGGLSSYMRTGCSCVEAFILELDRRDCGPDENPTF